MGGEEFDGTGQDFIKAVLRSFSTGVESLGSFLRNLCTRLSLTLKRAKETGNSLFKSFVLAEALP